MAAPLQVISMTEQQELSSRDKISKKLSQRTLHAAAKLLQQNTQEWMKQQPSGRLLADGTCPSCEERFMKESKNEEEESDSRIGSVIGKVQDMLNTDGSVLNTVMNVTKSALQKSGGNDDPSISLETLVPILLTAANHFTSISQNIQGTKLKYSSTSSGSDSVVSADTSDLVIAIYDLLEGIVVAIADVLFSIIDIISGISTAVVQFIVDVILAILDLIEGIKLGIIQIIVDFLNTITGNEGRRMLGLFGTTEDGPIATLKNILSSSRLGGIYNNVIVSLQERNDDTGLIPVLMGSAADMEVIDEKLDAFLYKANQAITADETSSSSEVSTISEDTVAEILDLIVDTISTILNLIVSIILTVLNVIVGVITAIIDLIISIIVGILDLIVAILNAILGIFSRQTGTASTQTATLLGIATTILASPIYDIILCQLGATSCTPEGVDCEMQKLACENEQLAKAMTE